MEDVFRYRDGFGSHSEANKKRHPNGWHSLIQDEGFDCKIPRLGILYGIDQFLNWSIKQSTGLFGFRWVRIPPESDAKKSPTA